MGLLKTMVATARVQAQASGSTFFVFFLHLLHFLLIFWGNIIIFGHILEEVSVFQKQRVERN